MFAGTDALGTSATQEVVLMPRLEAFIVAAGATARRC